MIGAVKFACRRRSLVVKAGHVGRSGRFIETAHVGQHALAATFGECAVADAAAAWRRGPASAVTQRWLRGRAAHAPEPPSVVVLTTRQPALLAAFELEVAEAYADVSSVSEGVFVARSFAHRARLLQLTCLRAELDPLACGATADELLADVATLDFDALGVAHAAALLDFEHVHERRGSLAGRLSSVALRARLGDAMRRPMCNSPSLAAVDALRFAVVETDWGLLFGVVRFAPPSASAAPSAWASKPKNYCAGLPFELAALGVSIATQLQPDNRTLVDPCSGAGTVVYAALCAGVSAACGVEIEASLTAMAGDNIAACGRAIDASRRRAGLGGSPPPVAKLECADSFSVRHDADAIVCNLPFGRVTGVIGSTDEASGATLAGLLEWLRPQAKRHVFFTGAPVGDTLRRLGFTNVKEVSVDTMNRRYMAVCG